MKYKILFFLLFTITSFSQPFTEDVKHVLLTGRNIVTAPLHWDTQDVITFAGTVLITTGAFYADQSVKAFTDRSHSSFNDVIFKADEVYFYPQAAAGYGGLYLYGLIFNDKDIRRLGLHLGEACGYAALITTIIKESLGRSRPYILAGNHDFKLFNGQFAQTSFPSGHTTVAFAFSTVMADYMDNFYWKAGWYTAAGLVASARIYHQRHWLSDVVFGFAIGHFVGEYVVNTSEEKNKIELGIIPSGFYLRVAL